MEQLSSQGASQENIKPPFEVQSEKGFDWIMRHRSDYPDIGDEEALIWCALTADHPELHDHFLSELIKHKPHIAAPEELLQRIKDDMTTRTDDPINHESEIQQWQKDIPEVEGRISALISYFSPNYIPSRVQIIPSDTFIINSGRGFRIGDQVLISSHTGNLDNVEHEFAHSFMNETVERFAANLSPEQLSGLFALCNRDLRINYGDNVSLLCEEFIRTYNNYIKKGELPMSLDEFKAKLTHLSEKDFDDIKTGNKRLSIRLQELAISSLQELRQRTAEYYNRFERDEMRDRLIIFYSDYNEAKKTDPTLRFEQFLSKNGLEILTAIDVDTGT